MSVVLVTGASRGIGAATARLAAAKGWAVGVNYNSSAEAAEQLVRTIADEGGSAVAIKGDVAVEDDVIAMFDDCEQALGPITGLVNNAGMLRPAQTLTDTSLERWERVFAVNVTGSFLCAREAIRRITKAGDKGTIVNVSSMGAVKGGGGEFVDYAASKGAVETMTIGLANEVGPAGIRVNAVRPGLIATDIHIAAGDPERAEKMLHTVPLGRVGEPGEVAECIVWLMSDAAGYVNGSVLTVSGGR